MPAGTRPTRHSNPYRRGVRSLVRAPSSSRTARWPSTLQQQRGLPLGGRILHTPPRSSSSQEEHRMDLDAVVVGAGHNGLVAAWYLARAGLRVHVFERRPFPGGAAITEELWPGFHFSTCAHMVHAVHPRIIRDLRLRERGFEVLEREPTLLLNEDGTYFGPAGHDSPRNLSYADRLTPDEREGLRRLGDFRRTLEAIFAPYRLGPPPSPEAVRR